MGFSFSSFYLSFPEWECVKSVNIGEDMDKSMVSPFLTHGVYLQNLVFSFKSVLLKNPDYAGHALRLH